VLHALLDGFEVAFSAEESEISGWLFCESDSDDNIRLLVHEAAGARDG
jgi:hypothetical protein